MTLRDDYFKELEGQRREAYVHAVLRAAETDDVVGYIGARVPVMLFYAFGLMALPVHGIDGDILKFSKEDGLCPVIDATMTYAKTDRCPLIHSSRLIVVDDSCPLMAEELGKMKEKDIYIYHLREPGRDRDLEVRLETVYGRRKDVGALENARRKLEECAALLSRLKDYSDLSGLRVYILEYYLNFLSLDARLDILHEVSESVRFSEEPVGFVPVRVQSGAGIYRQIDRIMDDRPYRIFEIGCGEESGDYDFVYDSCPFAEGTRMGYEQS